MSDRGGVWDGSIAHYASQAGKSGGGRGPVQMRVEQEGARVALSFDQNITWIGLNPKDAERLGQRMIDVARRAQKDQRHKIELFDKSSF